jgi:hypothetical protein
MTNARMQIIIDGESAGAINASKQASQAIGNVGKQVQDTTSRLENMSKALNTMGRKLSLAVTAPMILVGKQSIQLAMDVVESQNLFNESMGSMAEAATNWSNQFAESVGLNEYNVRKNLGIFNVMFDSMDMGTEKSYELAQGLTQLAYDMASFYNINVEDAFLKLQAGIMGEIEPLRRLGIVVNETTVANWAYANGLVAQGGQLTEQEKILARYNVIMEATSKAQGDLARTIESPANQMRIFKEQVNLAMIELGKNLIPIMQKALDIIKPWIEKFADLNDTQKEWIVKLGILAAAAGPLALATGQALSFAKAIVEIKTAMKGSMLLGGMGLGPVAAIGAAAGIIASVGIAAIQTGDSIDVMANKTEEYKATLTDLNQRLREWEWTTEHATGANAELHKKLVDVFMAAREGKIDLVEATNQFNELMGVEEELAAVTGVSEVTLDAMAESLDGMGESADGATKEVKSLITELWKIYNLNQSITDITWDFNDAVVEAEKVLKDKNSTDRQQQEALFGVQDAYEKLTAQIETNLKSGELTHSQQYELQAAFMESGAKMVELKQISQTEFETMAKVLGINVDKMGVHFKKIGDDANKATEPVKSLKAYIEGLQSKEIAITTNLYTVNHGAKMMELVEKRKNSPKQSGGVAQMSSWATDLNIPLVKGEAVLPAPVVKAIKQNQSSFAGLGSGNNAPVINVTVTGNYLSDEVDEERLAQKVGQSIMRNLKLQGAYVG